MAVKFLLPTTAHESCQNILQFLRSSSLDFLIQESSYLAYVTIWKKFRKDSTTTSAESFHQNLCSISELQVVKRDMENLRVKLEESVLETKELNIKVCNYKNSFDNLNLKLREAIAINYKV